MDVISVCCCFRIVAVFLILLNVLAVLRWVKIKNVIFKNILPSGKELKVDLYSLFYLLIKAGEQTSWRRCCWDLMLQTWQEVSGMRCWTFSVNTQTLEKRCVLPQASAASSILDCIRRRCWRTWWSDVCPKATSFKWRWLSVPDSSTTQWEK